MTFIYYDLQNLYVKENGSPNFRSQFNTVRDIEEIDVETELQNEPPLDRLIVLLNGVKKKFDFYSLLKQINSHIAGKEFKEEKLLEFKEILLKRLEEFSEKRELDDKILLPYIFTVLKKAFFKLAKSQNGGQPTNKQDKLGSKSPRNKIESNNKLQMQVDYEKIQERNCELLIKFFTVSFSFLRVDIQEDITLSALNFIFRYLEEALPIKVNNRITTVKYHKIILNNYLE